MHIEDRKDRQRDRDATNLSYLPFDSFENLSLTLENNVLIFTNRDVIILFLILLSEHKESQKIFKYIFVIRVQEVSVCAPACFIKSTLS